jgi:hypothetical protein
MAGIVDRHAPEWVAGMRRNAGPACAGIRNSALGRFLQADPIVQDPTNGQNFNRYTYVWNNPLAYTDPSGFISVGGWISHLMTVIQIASWFIPGLQPLAAFLNGAGGLMRSFVTAFVIGGLTTGSFRGAWCRPSVRWWAWARRG